MGFEGRRKRTYLEQWSAFVILSRKSIVGFLQLIYLCENNQIRSLNLQLSCAQNSYRSSWGGFQLMRITGLSLYSVKPDLPKAWQVNTFKWSILCVVCLVPQAVALEAEGVHGRTFWGSPHPTPAPALPAAAQKDRSTGWKPRDSYDTLELF